MISAPDIGGVTGRTVLVIAVIAALIGKETNFIGVLVAVICLDQQDTFADTFKTDATTNEGMRELFVHANNSRRYIASRDQ